MSSDTASKPSEATPVSTRTRKSITNSSADHSTCAAENKLKKHRKNNKAIEMKDVECQFEDPQMKEEIKLLKLENCTISNKFDELTKDYNVLKKINHANTVQLSVLGKQLACSDEIISINEKLKSENRLLTERCEKVTNDEIERLKQKICSLEEVIVKNNEDKDKMAALQERVDILEYESRVTELTISGLKESLAEVIVSEKEDDEQHIEEDPKSQSDHLPKSQSDLSVAENDTRAGNSPLPTERNNRTGKKQRFQPYDNRYRNNQNSNRNRGRNLGPRKNFDSRHFYNSRFQGGREY